MSGVETETTNNSKRPMFDHALQIIGGGAAYATAFMIELLGRDTLSRSSYWALVLFSLAVPAWLVSWMMHTHMDSIQAPKRDKWVNERRNWIAAAFGFTVIATALELCRVVGTLGIGFAVVILYSMTKVDRLMDDQKLEEHDASETNTGSR